MLGRWSWFIIIVSAAPDDVTRRCVMHSEAVVAVDTLDALEVQVDNPDVHLCDLDVLVFLTERPQGSHVRIAVIFFEVRAHIIFV